MEKEIMNLIDKVIEMLEDDEFQSYFYTNNRFHIVNEDEDIDLEAKIYNNNFYFKDNVNKLLYMYTKKYLDKDTSIQKILINNDAGQFFYSYLERYCFTKLLGLIRKEGKDFIKYVNKDLIKSSDKELIKFADENLSEYSRYGSKTDDKMDIKDYAKHYFESHSNKEDDYPELEELSNEDLLEDEEFIDEFDEFDEFDDFDENDKIVFEEDIDDEEMVTASSTFEGKTISEYKEAIDEQAKTYKMVKYTNQKEDKKLLLDYYKNVEIIVNNKIIQGTEKIIMAGDSDVIVEEKYLDAVLVCEYASNLKMVLDEKEKFMENWEENER